MLLQSTFWIWTQGAYSVDITLALHPSRRYLVTGGLVGTTGGDWGQVYISTICTMRGDAVFCSVRDESADSEYAAISGLGLVEVFEHASRVIITLRSSGGRHRAEGAIYDIT